MKKTFILVLFLIPFVVVGQNILMGQGIVNEKIQERINYWENGHKLSEIQYLNSKREGTYKYWYKSGNIMNEGCYKNGKMIGPFISYYDNGQIESQGSFKYTESGVNSRKSGVWKYYHKNGNIELESIIKNGIEELKFYDLEGNLLTEGQGC